MLVFEPGARLSVERESHCTRVLEMARSVAGALTLSEQMNGALHMAADDHRPLEFPQKEERAQAGDSATTGATVELASEIFATCDEFDSVVESCALDSSCLVQEIDDFVSLAPEYHRPDVVVALKKILVRRHRGHSGQLPVMPLALTELLQFRAEDLNVTGLAGIAAMDQVLAGRLLSAANSALFGARHQIIRLTDAVGRVGVPIAHKLLLQACVGKLFASSPLQELWRHSQLAAAVASELAVTCGIDPNLAFVGGLLHDIGRLELIRETPENQQAIQTWLDRGYPMLEAEGLTFGSNHALRGGEMLHDWNLPDAISQAISIHHTPESAKDCRLAYLLFLVEVWIAERKRGAQETLTIALRLGIAQEGLGLTNRQRLDFDLSAPLLVMALAA